MFSTIASARFRFLEAQHGFERILDDGRCLLFRKGDSVIRFTHTRFDEVSMTLSQASRGTSFSPDLLVSLMDPAKGKTIREMIVSGPDQIDAALAEFEALLKAYGKRVLDNDVTVFNEMKALSEAQSLGHEAQAIRHRAEEALAAKDFGLALREYRLLGKQRTGLDSKRMEMCERQVGEG